MTMSCLGVGEILVCNLRIVFGRCLGELKAHDLDMPNMRLRFV